MDLVTKETQYALEKLGENARKSVSSVGFLKPVLSVEKTELAINAFQKMHDQKVSALAVTDNGRVCKKKKTPKRNIVSYSSLLLFSLFS